MSADRVTLLQFPLLLTITHLSRSKITLGDGVGGGKGILADSEGDKIVVLQGDWYQVCNP